MLSLGPCSCDGQCWQAIARTLVLFISNVLPHSAGMASMKAAGELDEDSEEDLDFDMKSADDDEGEPSDESDAESGDAEIIDEQPKVSMPISTVESVIALGHIPSVHCQCNHSVCFHQHSQHRNAMVSLKLACQLGLALHKSHVSTI